MIYFSGKKLFPDKRSSAKTLSFCLFLHYSVLTLLIFYLVSCAQVGVLEGGPQDKEPPKVIKTYPPAPAYSFNQSFIKFYFDEPVVIRNPMSEIKIYPQGDSLIKDIEFSSKSLTILLNTKKLLPNTTYQLHTGNAIADLHEGNVLKNYTYIFSTGTGIDTCKISGTLKYYHEKNKNAGLHAGLFKYEETLEEDSVFMLKKPDYIVPCQDDQFKFNYIAPGKYLLAVSQYSPGQPYFFSPFKTLIAGRYPGILNIHPPVADSVTVWIYTSFPVKSSIVKKEFDYYGKISIRFKEPCNVTWKKLNGTTLFSSLSPVDSLVYYVDDTSMRFSSLIYYPDYKKTDTLVLTRKKNPNPISVSHKIIKENKNVYLDLFFPGIPTIRSCKKPIRIFLTQKDSIRDTISDYLVKDSINMLRLSWKTDSAQTGDVLIKTDSTCFTISGMPVATSIIKKISVPFAAQDVPKGKLILRLLFYKKGSYILRLKNASGNTVAEKTMYISLSEANEKEVSWWLPADETYFFECVFDEDENGIWTNGNFYRKIIPEKIIRFDKKIRLMPKWDIIESFEIH